MSRPIAHIVTRYSRVSALVCSAISRRAPRQLVFLFSIGFVVAGASAQSLAPSRIAQLNEAFLKHLDTFDDDSALAVAAVRRGWQETYREQSPESFVPDALAVLYPAYREALQAFDRGKPERVIRLLSPLRAHKDPFLAAGAAYFHSRALVDRSMLEESQALLRDVTAAPRTIERFTPYAPHLWFMKGYCESSNLDFEAAAKSLRDLSTRFRGMPEAIKIGARQLRLALERRKQGTLDEVSELMDYAATRLKVTDTRKKVRGRQSDVIALLDKLIEETEQREKQQQQQGGGSSRRSGRQSGSPRGGRDQSSTPGGAGRIGDLHDAPQANPGEMWGKLPPSERDAILQSLRERFPSRYRQLVEQYYRSLAEQK